MWMNRAAGIVNLWVPMLSPGVEVGGLSCALSLRSDGRARDLLPNLESLGHLLAVLGGRQQVTSRSEVLGNWAIGGEEPLGLPCRLEPLHAPLSLASGLMGVIRAVMEVPMLAVLHRRKHLLLRRAVAFQLVGDDDTRHVRQPL
jgi:hypothetical protein